MVQWAEALAAKPDQSWISRTYMVGEEKRVPKAVLWPPCVPYGMCAPKKCAGWENSPHVVLENFGWIS